MTVQCWRFSDFLLMNKINSNMCSQLSFLLFLLMKSSSLFLLLLLLLFLLLLPRPLSSFLFLFFFFFLKFMSVPESTQLHTTNSRTSSLKPGVFTGTSHRDILWDLDNIANSLLGHFLHKFLERTRNNTNTITDRCMIHGFYRQHEILYIMK